MQQLALMVWEAFHWRGRASRRAFYLSIGRFYLVGLLAMPLVTLQLRSSNQVLSWIFGFGALAAGVVLLASLSGAVVRRLHDRNKSGWWFLAFFCPHALWVAALSSIPEPKQQTIALVFVAGFLALPFSVWGLVEICILRGVQGDNMFGPDPLERNSLPAPAPVHL